MAKIIQGTEIQLFVVTLLLAHREGRYKEGHRQKNAVLSLTSLM